MKLKNLSLNYGTRIFRSFSEEPRIRMLFIMNNKVEVTISDLERILDYTQAKTSRHINYLKNAGLVKQRKYEQWTFYSIKDEVQEIISLLFEFLNKDNQLQQDLENYEIMYSNRELATNKIESKNWKK